MDAIPVAMRGAALTGGRQPRSHRVLFRFLPFFLFLVSHK